uniref:Putative lipocalin ai-5 triatoma dimidiata lipocalin n=1 Tax=Rhodnius prolixus TaxID=13249 RepID=A0A4P6DAA6_RHOPR
MNTIILITIFGILLIRRIQCIECDCESVEAAGNDGEFFKGNWQVTHSKIGAMFPICGKLETSSQDGKKIIKLDDEEDGTLEIKCTGSKESDCEAKKDSGKITGLFRVVSTDNSNYALVYICTKPTSFPKVHTIRSARPTVVLTKGFHNTPLPLLEFLTRSNLHRSI